jgi:predicted enzyme related to lactoylglutathione lyase
MPRNTFTRFAASLAALTAIAAAVPTVAHAAFPPLNSPATTQTVPGKFIWADLFTSQPDVAATFYTKLLGWTAQPVEQDAKDYIILSNGGHPVAGIVMRGRSGAPRPGVWISYLSVPDATSALSNAKKYGAVERAPIHSFPDRGNAAIITDGEGTVVGLLQSTSGDPADLEPNPGDWNWFELYSKKPQAAAEFYRDAFGYAEKADDRAGKENHFVLSMGGQARAGVAPLPISPDAKSGWLGCVRVADIEDACSRVAGLGGKVLVEPRPASLGSRFAVVADPTGSAIALIQYVDNANPAARP